MNAYADQFQNPAFWSARHFVWARLSTTNKRSLARNSNDNNIDEMVECYAFSRRHTYFTAAMAMYRNYDYACKVETQAAAMLGSRF